MLRVEETPVVVCAEQLLDCIVLRPGLNTFCQISLLYNSLTSLPIREAVSPLIVKIDHPLLRRIFDHPLLKEGGSQNLTTLSNNLNPI